MESDRCIHGIRHPHPCDECEAQWALEAEAQRRPGESTLDLYARLDAELDASRRKVSSVPSTEKPGLYRIAEEIRDLLRNHRDMYLNTVQVSGDFLERVLTVIDPLNVTKK